MKFVRRIVTTVIAVALLSLTVTPLASASEGSLSGAVAQEAATDATAWFQNTAPSVVRSNAADALPDLSADDVAAITVGTPINVKEFPENLASSLKDTTIWVAPLYLSAAPIGTVATDFHSGQSRKEVITASKSFAEALADPPDGTLVVLEPRLAGKADLGAWFQVDGDGMVSPLDPVADSILAGSVTLAQYADIRLGLIGGGNKPITNKNQGATTPDSSGGVVRTAVLVLAILLAVLGVIVWLRRELEEESVPEKEDTDAKTGRKIFRRGADEVHIYEVPPDKAGRDTGIMPVVRVAPAESMPLGGAGDTENDELPYTEESDTDEHSDD